MPIPDKLPQFIWVHPVKAVHPESGYDLIQQDPDEWRGSRETFKQGAKWKRKVLSTG
jgi:hypothetical protein